MGEGGILCNELLINKLFYVAIVLLSLSQFLLRMFNKLKAANASHIFWVQFPCPHCQCCFQVSETVSWHKLRCYYSFNMLQNWVRGRSLTYFCKVDHSRISGSFSRNWVGVNNLCEILQENLHRLKEDFLRHRGCQGCHGTPTFLQNNTFCFFCKT